MLILKVSSHYLTRSPSCAAACISSKAAPSFVFRIFQTPCAWDEAQTQRYQISTRSMASSAKPTFSWEEKRTLGVNTPEELEKRIIRIKNLASEARNCIKDCDEVVDTEYFDEELASAKAAVERTGIAFSELLEELALTNEGVQLLNEVRRLHASEVESLRLELSKFGD
mmetsp:Transcript_19312/g.40551  ORF Transcript_19312/g.40551 Transcript_19312/m.40551 type:complete len:169 (-) Transcript_19312:404-910(-)